MITPWTIHEAEVALYPAWKDGLPLRGPGSSGGSPAPVFSCKSALSISGTPRKTAAMGYDWTGNSPTADGEWEISISFPEGAYADGVSRALSRLANGGFHILVVRFIDEVTGQWSCFRWYYATWESDESSESSQILGRSVRVRSTWMQEEVGSSAAPSLSPIPYGEVDWICGPHRVTCYTFNPLSETWLSLPRNSIGEGGSYVTFAPVEGALTTDVALSALFPRVVGGGFAFGMIQRGVIEWQQIPLLQIGNQDSTEHHGLTLMGDLDLQAIGISEPLLTHPRSRVLDEPVIVFRYLRRVYATLGHGVLAVPSLTINEDPPFTHDYAFRLAIPGDFNPATGQAGLTLLPDGAWLDGELAAPVVPLDAVRSDLGIPVLSDVEAFIIFT